MNSAVSLEEASRDFPALLRALAASHREAVILENGRRIAKIIPFADDALASEEELKSYEGFHTAWLRETTEEEREAFARDIEAGRSVVMQDIPNRWD
jgi:antitoxin (DNA-binding transcriptional repressor) of toxin-antitoxin stability system